MYRLLESNFSTHGLTVHFEHVITPLITLRVRFRFSVFPASLCHMALFAQDLSIRTVVYSTTKLNSLYVVNLVPPLTTYLTAVVISVQCP